jgi:hypothetical protein
MNLLNKLLLAIAAMAVVSGFALAKTIDQNSTNPGTASPDVVDSHPAFSESKPHSFADILDLRVGADHQMVAVAVDAASQAPSASLVQMAGVDDESVLALSDRPDAAGSVFAAVSSSDGKVIELPTVLLVPDAHAGRAHGPTDRQQMDGGFLFSVAAIPEPADWMTLLCGFVVVAFMARRKTSAVAD